jgi:hypothetical protein
MRDLEISSLFCPITLLDEAYNFGLKKPFLTRIDHISVEPCLLFSKVHFSLLKNDPGKNGENVVDAAFRIHDGK